MKYLIIFFLLTSHCFAQTVDNFQAQSNEIYQLFADEFTLQKRPTNLDLFWKGKWPIASSNFDTDTQQYVVSFWGGLYRHKKTTPRTWAFSVCHEIGHVLGDEPRSTLEGYLWGSSEGQADYYAAGKCLKIYYEYLYKKQGLNSPLSNWIRNEIIQTAKEMSDFFNSDFIGKGPLSSIEQKDLNIVEQTIKNDYPSIQCRVDTIIAGANCQKWPCTSGEGSRPKCWF